jgi:Predicted hydrolase (metallo-beta-lactamase superfamily)
MRSTPTLAVVLIIVLAGCGGGGVATTDDPTTTPAPTTTTTSAPTPADTNGTLGVHFINVGQSVSTLLVSPTGETMLIDTGHFRDDGEHVLQYLQRHDINRLNHMVVSHNDADHIGGNAAIIEHYETEADGIGAIYDPGIAATTQTYADYLDAVEAYNVTLLETRAGDQIPFEGVDVDVMGPPESYIENEARNENSIVTKFTYGETSFLFTGDAEDDEEAQLVSEYGGALNATVLKAGHHGSKSSTGEGLVSAVNPQAMVISSAYDSQYGHPNEEVLNRLGSTTTFWTATHGNTVLVSDGQQVSVRTQRDAPTDPQQLRNADQVSPGTTDPVEQRLTLNGVAPVVTDPPLPTVTDGGTPTGVLAVETVHADAAGTESENLNDEYITFTNTGGETLDLSGYTVSDEARHTYMMPEGVTLESDATLTLHTGSGTNTETDLYWGADSPVWNNGGDTITMTDPDGSVILEETYG